jgi:hypothetical protein
MIPIYENYGLYKPRMNVRKMVEELLMEVAPEYLQGFGKYCSIQSDSPAKKRPSQKIPEPRAKNSFDRCAGIL